MSQPTPSSLDGVWRDLRFGLRSLLRSPGFAAVAILCLGLGIGGNAALFSILNTVLLRPLPFAEPDRLIRVYERMVDGGQGSVSVPNYRDWAEQNTGFEQLAAYQKGSRNLQDTGNPERLQAVEATPALFSVLGTSPLLGRTFNPGVDEPGKAKVAIVSEEFWRHRFGGDPSLVGGTIRLDSVPYTVIGVMPASFDFPVGGETDVWVLFEPTPEMANSWDDRFLSVVGRLKPRMTLEQAYAQLVIVAARNEKKHPAEQTGRSVFLQPLRETIVQRVRPALLILFGAVGLVHLIACANVVNLLLARAASRQHEVAIRLALGVGRIRLIRQFLVESLVLAFAGAVLGLLLARWSLYALAPLAEGALPVHAKFSLDGHVFGFLLAIAVFSGIACGIVPAFQSSRGDVRDRLMESGVKITGSGRQQLFRNALVVLEIAVSLVLLVGAGLLLRGFLALSSTEPGLLAENVLTAHLPVPDVQLEGSTSRVFRPVLQKIRGIPGVRSAAMISMLPIQDAWFNSVFVIEGHPTPEPGQEPRAELRVASPGIFQSLGVPVLQGRDFMESDGESGPKVAIINKALARKHFPGENPLGQRLRFEGETFTILAIVGNVRQAGLDREPLAEIYVPYTTASAVSWLGDAVLVTRTVVPPESITDEVRAAVASVDPALPLYRVLTMQQVIDNSLAGRRLSLWLLAIFAGIALVLSAAGLYGVISYLVAQRKREIGVRIALGAQIQDVIWLVMRQGVALTGAGITLGLLGAFVFTWILESLLYGVSARDPLTYAALATVLAAVALLATWLPASRASRVDPILAIRAE